MYAPFLRFSSHFLLFVYTKVFAKRDLRNCVNAYERGRQMFEFLLRILNQRAVPVGLKFFEKFNIIKIWNPILAAESFTII